MTTEQAVAASHVVADRIVYTFGDRAGIITGHIDDHFRFVVEHVVALKPGILIPMLRAGIEEARGFGCYSVVMGIPDEFELAEGLDAAARRVGCTPYAHEDGTTYYERRLR